MASKPVEVAAWPPSRYTTPVSPDFPSLWDRYAAIIGIVWRVAFGYAPEPWQASLLRAALEIYPAEHPRAGQLRYRQVLISMGRQNGKTEVAAILGLIGLLRSASAVVIGIASSIEQSNLIYKRTLSAISRNPKLADLFHVSGTRGIRRIDGGGEYGVKPSKSAALQGIPIDLGLVDELHLLKAAVWGDLVAGTGGRPDAIVVGITTAGSDASELLLRLYKLAAEAIADTEPSRFGTFIWEAPTDTIPADDAEFLTWLKHANPSLASGRRDAEATISDARSLPPADVLRYLGNRFVTGAAAPFIDPAKWAARTRVADSGWPVGVTPLFSFDRSPDWAFGSIVAVGKDSKGVIHTELVASMVVPTLQRFTNAALALAKHSPTSFVMDKYALGDLGVELRRRGLPVRMGTQVDAINAASGLYAAVSRGKLLHAGDPLLSAQIPHAIRKNIRDNYRIARAGLGVEIDAVLATALGALVAETTTEVGVQVF